MGCSTWVGVRHSGRTVDRAYDIPVTPTMTAAWPAAPAALCDAAREVVTAPSRECHSASLSCRPVARDLICYGEHHESRSRLDPVAPGRRTAARRLCHHAGPEVDRRYRRGRPAT